ncbi:MAG: hypothetical protein EOP04_33275 [Proteobacteria bacterium]|nr:MAG: hypothetical protein EOP04_33275 [Pseudomonadota bacterium]
MTTFNPTLEVIRNTVNADVDLSEVSDLAKEYAIHEENDGSILKTVMKSKVEKANADRAHEQFTKERNENLMRTFDATEPKYKTIVFAWGAGHSVYISEALKARGYLMTKEESKKAFSFFDVPKKSVED